VAGLHQCLPESNCQDQLEDHLEGKVDRFIKTADYICSDDIKPGPPYTAVLVYRLLYKQPKPLAEFLLWVLILHFSKHISCHAVIVQ